MIVKEYRRTCNQCGTVWHSLAQRESNLKWYACSEGTSACLDPANVFTCGMCGGPAQRHHNSNVRTEALEIDRLKTCPHCNSKNYTEETVEYEK